MCIHEAVLVCDTCKMIYTKGANMYGHNVEARIWIEVANLLNHHMGCDNKEQRLVTAGEVRVHVSHHDRTNPMKNKECTNTK